MNSQVFNLNNLFPGDNIELREMFEKAMPYPHALLPNALNPVFCQRLCSKLGNLTLNWTRVKEFFYEHDVSNFFSLSTVLGGVFTELIEALEEPDLVKSLCYFVGSPEAKLVNVTGHKLYDGDYINTHNDHNSFGETFRLLMFPEPNPQFSGGVLLLQEQIKNNMITRVQIPYSPFQVYLFRFTPDSYHAVTSVKAKITGANRFTILATYGCL